MEFSNNTYYNYIILKTSKWNSYAPIETNITQINLTSYENIIIQNLIMYIMNNNIKVILVIGDLPLFI